MWLKIITAALLVVAIKVTVRYSMVSHFRF